MSNIKELVQSSTNGLRINEKKVQSIVQSFAPHMERLQVLMERYNALQDKQITPEVIAEATEIDREMGSIARDTQENHDTEKKQSLIIGQGIDKINKTIKDFIGTAREKLKTIKDHFKNIEIARIQELQYIRSQELERVGIPIQNISTDLGSKTETEWNIYKSGVIQIYNDNIQRQRASEIQEYLFERQLPPTDLYKLTPTEYEAFKNMVKKDYKARIKKAEALAQQATADRLKAEADTRNALIKAEQERVKAKQAIKDKETAEEELEAQKKGEPTHPPRNKEILPEQSELFTDNIEDKENMERLFIALQEAVNQPYTFKNSLFYHSHKTVIRIIQNFIDKYKEGITELEQWNRMNS